MHKNKQKLSKEYYEKCQLTSAAIEVVLGNMGLKVKVMGIEFEDDGDYYKLRIKRNGLPPYDDMMK